MYRENTISQTTNYREPQKIQNFCKGFLSDSESVLFRDTNSGYSVYMELDFAVNMILATVGRNVAYLIVAGVFCLFIAALVFVWWRTLSHRKLGGDSLDALKKRDTILEAVTFAAEKFLEKSEWESSATIVLEHLGLATNADRVHIFAINSDDPQNTIMIQRFEWNAPGISSVTNTNDKQQESYLEFGLEQWAESLSAGEIICEFVRDLPEKQQELLVAHGVKSILVIPIFVGTKWWGFVAYEDCNRERKWLASEIGALKTASRILGTAIHNEQVTQELEWAYHQEINIGLEIQNRLLVGKPPDDIWGAKVAAISIPSQQIDGDFYDFIRYNPQHFDLVIGDVMGKGVSGALLGAATKNQLLQAAGNLVCSTKLSALPTPEEIVTEAHEQMCDKFITLNSFATICCARFSLDKQRMDFVDCGFTKTLHYRKQTDDCLLLKGVNFPLGFDRNEVFEQTSIHLEHGDIVLFYSNGLVESKNLNGDPFGVKRLKEFLVCNASLEPEELIRKLYREIIEFTNSAIFEDDLTCIAVKIDIPASEKILLSKQVELTSDMSNLQVLRKLLGDVFDQTKKVNAEFASKMEIAVIESATNIIQHSYDGANDRRLEVKIDVYENRIVVFLSHWGEAFRKFQMSTPSFDGSQFDGYGLYLMRQCVDEILYNSDEETNRHTVELLKML